MEVEAGEWERVTSERRIGGRLVCFRMWEAEFRKSRLGRWPLAPSAGVDHESRSA